MLRCQENNPNTSMTHVACESKLRSLKMSPIHPSHRNWVAIGHTVMYKARATHTFCAGIKCRHCISMISLEPEHFWKLSEGEMFIRSHQTNLLYVCCDLMVNSKDIFKTIRGPDDNCLNDLWLLEALEHTCNCSRVLAHHTLRSLPAGFQLTSSKMSRIPLEV